MRLNKSDKIGGQPILQVRNFLRKHEHCFDVEMIGKHFKLDDESSEHLVKVLSDGGYLQLDTEITERNGERVWEITPLGLRLAAASALKPISREKAERLVSELLDRVNRVREDDEYLWEVESLGVFGSYTSGSKDLGDIDLTLALRRKEKFQKDWTERSLEQAANSGKNLSRHVDQIVYAERKVSQFLNDRSRYLSFHRPEELEKMDAEVQILYQVDAELQD